MAEEEKKEIKEEVKQVKTETPVEVPAPTAAPVASAAPAGGKKQLNWVVTLILSILFGTLGVDRFMMGQIGLGILKLITGGGCGIWWLIDVILIAMKKDFPGIEWVE